MPGVEELLVETSEILASTTVSAYSDPETALGTDQVLSRMLNAETTLSVWDMIK